MFFPESNVWDEKTLEQHVHEHNSNANSKGENSTTCDPWTSMDFMEEMRNHSAQCRHCLSDCDHITYLPTITTAEFR